MSDRETSRRWLRLSEEDNVVVLTDEVAAGEELCGPQGERWIIETPLGIGHKVAARAISPGEAVLKYGFPIGVATAPIPAGVHVHTHNLRSAHIPFEPGDGA